MGFGWGGLTRTIQYGGQPPAPTGQPVNATKLSQAIKSNETGGQKNPYSFRQPSGAGDYANGAYQVRDSELKTYAPRYLGQPITSQQFLDSPAMQDNYMNAKASSLAQRGLTPEQILAVHRGGGSDLTAPVLSSLVNRYQGYVSQGMKFYGQLDQPVAPPSRSFQDLTTKMP